MDGRERGSTFIYNPLKALELLLQRADIQPIRFFFGALSTLVR